MTEPGAATHPTGDPRRRRPPSTEEIVITRSIAVVTGASRGAGKGIALALGKAGATVYVTGRTRAAEESPYGGSVFETAEMIDEAGGHGVPVVVDHADDGSVEGLFQQIADEQGRLDILVNNAAKLNGITGPMGFWEKPLEAADLISVGLRSHYVAAYYAAPLLLANGRGMIVATGHYGAVSYYQGPAYGAQKAGADKMAADMAHELRPYGVASVSIWMGGLDTERARAYLDTLPAEQRPSTPRESPEFTGRVISALYAREDLMDFSGRTMIGAELGARLGVTDIDGTTPLSQRYRMGGPPEPHASLL
ncbi:SDR family NAD(P)-dependent oxidoreductase [Streptomyces sp. NPDC089424]|uniref:SDR family NAD(P)-dependent oxidoreductase n=1 Tax=Streptomyces sp. NPDC089424 TaxID=3365917 RepID=UPI0037F7FDE1